MPKLPEGLVKRTAFDSPLRRTTSANEATATTDLPGATDNGPAARERSQNVRSGEGLDGVVLPFDPPARVETERQTAQAEETPTTTTATRSEPTSSTTTATRSKRTTRLKPAPTPTTEQPATEHRITVRIDDATRCALETECHRRRIGGEKVTVAEIARSILAERTSRAQ
jgi:hypothetical protein